MTLMRVLQLPDGDHPPGDLNAPGRPIIPRSPHHPRAAVAYGLPFRRGRASAGRGGRGCLCVRRCFSGGGELRDHPPEPRMGGAPTTGARVVTGPKGRLLSKTDHRPASEARRGRPQRRLGLPSCGREPSQPPRPAEAHPC
ncbi:hypothetical protein SCOCK_320024 [Actinacidiphila cocklensis]|uniref:Uncharacterized protein n=1 Tax=Actinacidiphila cocklensis TaxID=887465 RepID=A0A9W4GT45_9ACTN|nr:hypothetical protein SCOCK_320024 [Actinacidiphila cocklensis]